MRDNTVKYALAYDAATGVGMQVVGGDEQSMAAWLVANRKQHAVMWLSPEQYESFKAVPPSRVVLVEGVPQLREETYAEKRAKEYPSPNVQFDALWHAMDIGEMPKAKQFYDDIKKIKDKYPKP